MKEIWTLVIKTSLPSVCLNADTIETEVLAFEKFEAAKSVLRERLRNFAFSKNAMFDGKGGLRQLNDYIRDMIEDEEIEEFYGWLTKKMLGAVAGALSKVFSGKDANPKIEQGEFADGMIGFEYEGGTIRFFGEPDGAFNGYDPVLYTNMFDMTEKKDYFLYIDDRFGQDDFTSELYIDLKKTVLN